MTTPTNLGTPSQLKTLRLLAALGAAAVLVYELVGMFPLQPRQSYAFIPFFGILLVTLVLGVTLFRRSTQLLLRHPDLLVPIGLLIAFDSALAVVPRLGALGALSGRLELLSISAELSLMVILSLALHVLFAGWMTQLVLDVVLLDRSNLVAGFRNWRRTFLRTLVVVLLGWGLLFLVLGSMLTTLARAIPLLLVLMGVLAFVWNFCTVAVLPVVVHRRDSLWNGIRAGVRISVAYAKRWMWVLLAQLFVLGVLVYWSVTTTSALSFKSNAKFSVQVFWIGAYENSSRWYTEMMQVAEAAPVEFLSTLLLIVLTVVAIAVKLEIVSVLFQSGELDDGASPTEVQVEWSSEEDEAPWNAG